MLRPAMIVFCAALSVTGCARMADSKLNPFNWFGRSSEVATTQQTQLAPLVPANARGQIVDSRRMIDTITEFEIARTPAGAILRATGVAATQGSYNAQLVLIDSTDGNLVYEFRVSLPDGFNDIGTTRSRTISAATELSAAELAGVRQITVGGARNARSSRR